MQIRNRNLSSTSGAWQSCEKLSIEMKRDCMENLSDANACCLNAVVIGHMLLKKYLMCNSISLDS